VSEILDLKRGVSDRFLLARAEEEKQCRFSSRAQEADPDPLTWRREILHNRYYVINWTDIYGLSRSVPFYSKCG